MSALLCKWHDSVDSAWEITIYHPSVLPGNLVRPAEKKYASSMTREEYTEMDVEDYFNYMGMLAAEASLQVRTLQGFPSYVHRQHLPIIESAVLLQFCPVLDFVGAALQVC